MAELVIQNPSITPNDFGYDGGAISSILGVPLVGAGGGGTIIESDFVWLPSVTQEGVISWQRASSATAPSTANIMGPQGPQGPSGTNGTDGDNGADGISPTFTITPTAGGTHVVLSGAQGEESFDVLSGAAGAKGQDGANGFSPTVSTATVNADASHTNGGVQVDITYKDGSTTATESYTAWHGNNGEGFVEASHYQSLSAGYADYARFSDNSVSSMDQLKGSIDWGNGIAGEYQTHSGDFVTSSSQTITGDKQYALTTAGWAEVQTGTSFTGVNTDATLTGDGSIDNLGVAWSALSGNTIASANKAREAQGFRWGDNTYQDTSAALTNLWNAKNHVTLQTANNILTVDNNDNTSATLSAMSYVNNTAHGGWLPQRSCVCQESEIFGMSELADGQGMLFFVVSAH